MKTKYIKPEVKDLNVPMAWGAQCNLGYGVGPTGPGNCKTGYTPSDPGICRSGELPMGGPNDCASGLGV